MTGRDTSSRSSSNLRALDRTLSTYWSVCCVIWVISSSCYRLRLFTVLSSYLTFTVAASKSRVVRVSYSCNPVWVLILWVNESWGATVIHPSRCTPSPYVHSPHWDAALGLGLVSSCRVPSTNEHTPPRSIEVDPTLDRPPSTYELRTLASRSLEYRSNLLRSFSRASFSSPSFFSVDDNSF